MKLIIDENAQYIIKELEDAGFEAFLVGGSVRDLLLGRPVQDWDITTNALPAQVKEIFPQTVDTGIKHGTLTVLVNGCGYEITTYRVDGDYWDYRRPVQVYYTHSLEEDLRRRDFTINAMAYNERRGLVDPWGGRRDLAAQLIAAVGNPVLRFREDALRMMRALRLAGQLEFVVDSRTFQAIYMNRELITRISPERIRDELNKILMTKKPSRGINLLKDSGLLKLILPELNACIRFNQRNPHHHYDVYDHIMAVLDATPLRLELRLAALLHDIGKPSSFSLDDKGTGHFYGHHTIGAELAKEVLKRLKYDGETIKRVVILIREHMTNHTYRRMKNIKKFINRVGTAYLEDLFQLQIADLKGKGTKQPGDLGVVAEFREKVQGILARKEPLTLQDLALNGHDLLAAGVEAGRKVGETLDFLLEKVQECPELNSKEKLLALVRPYVKT